MNSLKTKTNSEIRLACSSVRTFMWNLDGSYFRMLEKDQLFIVLDYNAIVDVAMIMHSGVIANIALNTVEFID